MNKINNSSYAVKELTVTDVVKQAGGLDFISNVGSHSGNKYFINAETTIKEQLDWAHYLNLNNAASLDILDIGTGAGFFPFICRAYGHNVESCDELYKLYWDEGYEVLNLTPKNYLVEKNKSIGNIFGKKFDVIVSFRSFLGTTKYWIPQNEVDIWGIDEWKFFFKDCSKHLLKSDDSYIFFQCNPGSQLLPYVNMNPNDISDWGPKELGDFFLQFQKDQNGNRVLFGTKFCITKRQIDNEC